METNRKRMDGGLYVEMLYDIISDFSENKTEYMTFVETGTYLGETLEKLYNEFETLYTIELSEKYYKRFDKIIKDKNYKKIINYFGDTVDTLPLILEQSIQSKDKSIFWLDGHWSDGDTALGVESCPLFKECTSIDNLYIPDTGIIIIDDYRLFGGGCMGWNDISIENILLCFKNHKVEYNVDIGYDCMTLLIKK